VNQTTMIALSDFVSYGLIWAIQSQIKLHWPWCVFLIHKLT